jgi:hypothetical protein
MLLKELLARKQARQAHDRRLLRTIVQAATAGDPRTLETSLATPPQHDEQWHFLGRAMRAIGRRPAIHPSVRSSLITFWVRNGDDLRGEMIRAELVRLLQAVFPPYAGPDLTLYRGENGDWAKRTPSLSWTRSIDVARAFAQQNGRLHMLGGLVLQATVPAERIIVDLADHDYPDEQEVLVDARRLKCDVVERYPAVQPAGGALNPRPRPACRR